ncbi:MAG: hypothetical protein ABFS39_04955 [Pseudomonadota bacterium]
MQLNLIIDDWSMNLEITDEYMQTMGDSFDKLDRDMDKGRRLGQQFIKGLNQTQRCQIAADKLLSALESNNQAMALLMGGYIVSRMEGVKQVVIDNDGEPQETRFT